MIVFYSDQATTLEKVQAEFEDAKGDITYIAADGFGGCKADITIRKNEKISIAYPVMGMICIATIQELVGVPGF